MKFHINNWATKKTFLGGRRCGIQLVRARYSLLFNEPSASNMNISPTPMVSALTIDKKLAIVKSVSLADLWQVTLFQIPKMEHFLPNILTTFIFRFCY
jgi:hypothetical protein